jgi:uncharacterized membrane protein
VLDAPVRRTSVDPRLIPLLLSLATIAVQICYPLVHGHARNAVTIAVVLLFAAASVASAMVAYGRGVGAALLVVSAGIGLGADLVGVHTGVPFGHYHYTGGLGIRLFGVPLVIALAWTMFAWPAAVAARRLVTGFAARVVVGAWALAAWDVFLDPQLVSAGYWGWRRPDPHLPGVAAVPLTNYLGWLVVAVLVSLAVQALLRGREPVETTWPLTLFLWTYVGSIVALGAFLDLGAAAAWGALGMGVVALPLMRVLWRER